MKTIKREAKVGERIIITEVDPYEHTYSNGDIFEVAEVGFDRVYTCEERYLIYHSEYEVIVENETEADGKINEIEARFEKAVEQARKAIEELRLAAMAKGYEDARKDLTETKPKTLGAGDLAPALAKCVKENRDRLIKEANDYVPIVSPQQQRDAIVEQAKKDVTELARDFFGVKKYQVGMYMCDVDFVVNMKKRTVVALMAHRVKGESDRNIMSRGIAKCAPTDCFNAHVGKAIALRRALGLEVPAEYLNAPQPTEVRVGDIVQSISKVPIKYRVVKKPDLLIKSDECALTSIAAKNGKIIDDTRSSAAEGVDGE